MYWSHGFPHFYVCLVIAAVMTTFCLMGWRRHTLAMVSVASFGCFVALAASIPFSWNAIYTVGVTTPARVAPEGTAEHNALRFGGFRGNLRLEVSQVSRPPQVKNTSSVPESEGAILFFYNRIPETTLVEPSKNSVTKSLPAVEKLGFQLVVDVRPTVNGATPATSYLGVHDYVLVLPNWFILGVVCPVFPFFWWRKRRKRKMAARKGFPVTVSGAQIRAA